MACDSLDIDIKKKSIHHLKIENVIIHGFSWNIGFSLQCKLGQEKTLLQKTILVIVFLG